MNRRNGSSRVSPTEPGRRDAAGSAVRDLLRPVSRPAIGLLTLLALLALGAGPAGAAQTHLFIAGFAPAGGFQTPRGIAIDQESGEVYVADSAGSVYAFGPTGAPDPAHPVLTEADGTTPFSFSQSNGVAVDNSADATRGDIYVANTGGEEVRQFNSAGSATAATPITVADIPADGTPQSGGLAAVVNNGAFAPGPIIVAPDGDLIVGDFVNGVVDRFAPDGTFVSQLGAGQLTLPTGVAIDPAGDTYVSDGTLGLLEFGPGGSCLNACTALDPAATVGVTIDAEGNIYANRERLIAEYDPAGNPIATFGGPGGEPAFRGLEESSGLAVDDTSHKVYVDNHIEFGTGETDVFGPLVTLPEITTEAADAVGATSATLHGTVNPDGLTLADCHFDYVSRAAFESSGFSDLSSGGEAPCDPDAASIPADSNDHPVQAAIGGLQAGSSYRFRLQAAAAGGNPGVGQVESLETTPPPTIEAAAAEHLTASTVELSARIDPNGGQTNCRFEWGTTSEPGNPTVPYEDSGPCEPDEEIGSGPGTVLVSRDLVGLVAGTSYHWRVLATNPAGTTTGVEHTFIYLTTPGGQAGCGNEALRTGLSAALPDCRAYELVTPPQKNGALIGQVLEGLQLDLAEDGSRVFIPSIQGFAGTESGTASRQTEGEPYSFERTAAGWVTTPLAPPATRFSANSNWLYSADADTALFSIPNPISGEDDLYRRDPAGAFTEIGPTTSPSFGVLGTAPFDNNYTMGTRELSHVDFQLNSDFWPFDATVAASGARSVYEYSGDHNSAPALVGVSGGHGATDLISECGTELGGTGPVAVDRYGGMSSNGQLTFFTSIGQDHQGCQATASPATDEIYARVDGARSVPISRRSPGACTSAACLASTPGDAGFQGASADASKVFFTSTQQLTDDASEDSQAGDTASESGCHTTTGPNGCNLYLYEDPAEDPPSGHNLIDLSAGDSSGGGPRVRGVLAISSDGSHVYFVAEGTLTGETNAEGQRAEAGESNLYLYQRDAAHPQGSLTFVTTLAAADQEQWNLGVGRANVTPDGNVLVFTSSAPLTADVTRRDHAEQVFSYDAETRGLRRISIGERGFNDNGNAGSGDAAIREALRSFGRSPARSNPTMSDDGAFIFFTSPIALAPGALEDVPVEGSGGAPQFAQNVYEYHAGQVFLISDGKDTATVTGVSTVHLFGTDASGENVIFSTADRLTAADTDTQLDYYDARVGGGFATEAETTPCQGEACRAPAATSPSTFSPGSAGFVGPNATSPIRCGKGRVKRHGRCVKRRQAKHRGGSARKHHRGGAHRRGAKR